MHYLRISRDISEIELAVKMNMSVTEYIKLEEGNVYMSRENAEFLEAIYGVPAWCFKKEARILNMLDEQATLIKTLQEENTELKLLYKHNFHLDDD